MIFYFSGTGNSRRIALRLAGLTADKAVDIVSLTDIPDPKTERRIGLVFPVYAWGLPEPVESFLKRLPAADCYTFAAVTCGADAGHALKKTGKIRPLSAAWSVAIEYKQRAAGYSQSRNISVRCEHNIFQSFDSFRSFHNDLHRSKQKIDSSVNNEAQREDHRRLKDGVCGVDCARDGVRPQFVVRRGNGKPNQIGKHDG